MSNLVKTWRVIRWDHKPDAVRRLSLCCPNCGTDAEMDVGQTPGGIIIAAIGLGLIFFSSWYCPPDNFLADEIQCRTCRKIFLDTKPTAAVNVR